MPQPTTNAAFDASPRGLLRLYYGILLTTAAGFLGLHLVLNLLGAKPGPAGWFLPVLDLFLLVGAYLGRTLEDVDAPGARTPYALVPLALGVLLVILCFETGGLASPYFLLVLTTCVFAALTLHPPVAMLMVAVVGATYALGAWLISPSDGLIRGGLASARAALQAGRQMSVHEVTALVANCAFLFIGSYVALRLSKGYRASVKGLEESATRDPLTLLLNRRGFLSTMKNEISRAERYAWPIAILMVDLDHFKKVNDSHGHAFGDTVLKTSARLLREAVGTIDHLARVGGEEFSVAAVAADPNHGAELAQRVLRHFRSYDWGALKPGLQLTCSIGVAVLHPGRHAGDPEATLAALMEEADRGLYHVKQNGRNDFYVSDPRTPRLVPAPRT